jgi:hypothetical protein
MDRAPFQVADVHELLRSTLTMFADRLSKDSKLPKSLAIRAISTRYGPTSSTTR